MVNYTCQVLSKLQRFWRRNRTYRMTKTLWLCNLLSLEKISYPSTNSNEWFGVVFLTGHWDHKYVNTTRTQSLSSHMTPTAGYEKFMSGTVCYLNYSIIFIFRWLGLPLTEDKGTYKVVKTSELWHILWCTGDDLEDI